MAIGIVGGTPEKPHVTPLEHPLPVTPELLQLTEPVRPTEVCRFSARCMGKVCAQYADSRCALAAKVTRMLPEAIDRLPDCDIRPQCRWFAQEGEAACLRCPQVVTEDVIRSYVLALAADPTVPAGVGDDDKSRKGGQTR